MKIKFSQMKMRQANYLYFIGLGILLFSISVMFSKRLLKNDQSNAIKSNEVLRWIGNELFIPKDCSLIMSKLDKTERLTIISFIDGNCSICINDLIAWKTFIEEMRVLNNLNYLFITNAIDYNGFSNYVEKEIDFPFTLVNDENNSFVEINELCPDKFYQTFLIDNKNVVILCGSPIYNQKFKQLYKTEIQNRGKK